MNEAIIMKLSKSQEGMLTGKEGHGVKKAMEILVGMGEAQGAEKMVDITKINSFKTKVYPVQFFL